MKKILSIGLSLFLGAILLSGCSKTEETKSTKIPENCTSWFDGCNTCFVKDGEIAGCTRMACETNGEPKCMQFENEPVISTEDTNKKGIEIPESCTSWFDGCNNCMVKDGEIAGCTRMACEKNEEPKCMQFENDMKNQPAVMPKESNTIDSLPAAKIPENCTSWFDGCNNCTVKDGKANACTMMYCEEKEEPKCMQFKE